MHERRDKTFKFTFNDKEHHYWIFKFYKKESWTHGIPETFAHQHPEIEIKSPIIKNVGLFSIMLIKYLVF